jgi:predicted Na+-dependent transporter
MEDKIKEAKNTSTLFGILFLFCIVAAALGFYWYSASAHSFGLLVCAVLLVMLCIGSLYGRYYYTAKVRKLERAKKKD